MMTIEKLIRCIVEEAHLARHDKKSGSLTVILMIYINTNLILCYGLKTLEWVKKRNLV